MNDIIDTLDVMQGRELAWARLLMGEITEEAAEAQYKVEHGRIEMWQLLHMLERHLLKMNMVGSMLMTVDGTIDRAREFVKAVAK